MNKKLVCVCVFLLVPEEVEVDGVKAGLEETLTPDYETVGPIQVFDVPIVEN